MRLLLVDESIDVLDMLSEMTRLIAKVKVVGQTQYEEEAVNLFRSRHPDVVFIDLGLKNGSGISLLKRIKKENPAAIVFIFTNIMYSQYRRKCFELGANYLFDKLMEIPKAIQTLKDLAIQSKQKEKYRANG